MRPTARTLLLPLLALFLGLLAAPPGAAQPERQPQSSGKSIQRTGYAGYLFAYFTGEGTADGEQIRYALSRGNDALHWRELNAGKPVLSSTIGEKGLRDPFVIRSPEGDKFYMIATDLRMYKNSSGSWDQVQRHGSKSIMVWESTDLVNWTDQRLVKVSPDTAGNTWAPEAYWDDSLDAYVVFWASKLYAEDDPDHTGSTYNKMLYATTKDFRTFSEPKVWNDPGYSVIDSTVVKHDGTYYRYTKDERDPNSSSPCAKFITGEKSTSLTSTKYDFVADCIGNGAMDRGEGPTVFKSNTEEKWYLFIDEYGGRGYLPFETTDLDSGKWTPSTNYQLPASPRHGTVIPVTQEEYDRLLAAYPVSPTSVVDATAKDQEGYAIVTEASSKVVLPMEPDANLRRLAPKLWLGEGATISPRSGTPRDFRKPQKYTVTAADGTKRVWTVEAVPTRSPVLPGLYADPDVKYMNGRYWIYPTTDGFPGWSGTQFKAFSSKDLVHWTDHGLILDLGPDVTWADKNAWAPAIAERDGKYYFYFCAEGNIGVAVADSPAGPFKDALGKPLVAKGQYSGQAIDPSVFVDDGQAYLYWGNGHGYVVPLNDDMVSFDSAKVKDITPDNFREGSFVIKRNGTYYFMWSEDDTRSENYHVAYATGPTPLGPWTKRGTILSKRPEYGILATGHHSVVNAPGTDDWYMVYHRFALNGPGKSGGDGMHRETTIDRMEFAADGTIKPVVPTLESIKPVRK
ncbi:family 43 glycosylhydrolase [Streptomyces tailanensis]|uniref:family 43 glycosylhydrolase n=1 Tax=Streptomyces tailanensis TaxID=2569858 RepID=UPI00122E972A|nr:family 43 glycosylhydrolase [Streptomyces tailanensis]